MFRVIHGNDTFSIREKLNAVRAELNNRYEGEVELVRLSASEEDMARLREQAAMAPFIAPGRIVIATGVLNSAKSKIPLNDYIKDLIATKHPSVDVVFVEEQLTTRNPAVRDLMSVAEFIEMNLPRGRQALIERINSYLQKYQIKARGGVSERIADLIGNDMHRVDNELKKLALYALDSTITTADVDKVITPSREVRIFELIDAVMARQQPAAIRSFQKLLTQGESCSSVLQLLSRQTRLLLLLQQLLAQKMPPAEIEEQLGVRHKFVMDKLHRQVRGRSPDALKQIHRRLNKYDLAVKTGQNSERVAMEILIAELSSSRAR